jgi:hypothetical protein
MHTANGPNYGTCAKATNGVVLGTGVLCTDDGDCASGETCQKGQQDDNTNDIGDVCECYADITGSESVPDGEVGLTDLVVMKIEYFNTCPPEPCVADLNGDGEVGIADLVIMKVQYFRSDCALLP